MKNGMCVFDCVRACVCVCECVANGCTYMFDSLGSEGVNIIIKLIKLIKKKKKKKKKGSMF